MFVIKKQIQGLVVFLSSEHWPQPCRRTQHAPITETKNKVRVAFFPEPAARFTGKLTRLHRML
jgi:hypothetical protein